MIIFDTETVGLTGPLVTIQWCYIAYNEKGEIFLHKVWENSVNNTLNLIKEFCEYGVIGFNLTFDWFQLTKWFNIFKRVKDKNLLPNFKEIKILEAQGPTYFDLCLKPKNAIDLMLIARNTKFQYLAPHKDILIKKVPFVGCKEFIQELDKFIQKSLPPGVKIRWRFSQKKSGRQDIIDVIGEIQGLSTSLKHLASVILNQSETDSFTEAIGNIPYKDVPEWRPWGGNWEAGLNYLQAQFNFNEKAISYVKRDVELTYFLWKELGFPGKNGESDIDSQLACLVGASHWKGFTIDFQKLEEKLKNEYIIFNSAPTSPAAVRDFLQKVLPPTAQLLLTSTKKEILQLLGEEYPEAKKVEEARKAQLRINLLKKLKKANGLFFSMKVAGTLSNRMSGDSGMNITGIPREKSIRELFTLIYPGEFLEGGDFDMFEVSIADVVYQDKNLKEDLKNGKKIGAIVGSEVFGKSYSDILATKGSSDDKYTRSKNAFFAWLYGATDEKLAKVLGIEEFNSSKLKNHYPKIASYRRILQDQFTPLKQEELGGKVVWQEPPEYIETILGFRRFFTLEWAILRGLYKFAENYQSNKKEEVRRTNRVQSISGATRSALYAAIFALQAFVFRAAANHEIQSVGGQITKFLQAKIWDCQPVGISNWQVRPINIHDEIICPTTIPLKKVVDSVILHFKEQIPFIGMEWKSNLKNWGEK